MEELLGVITGLAVIGKLNIGMTKALIILVLINSVIGFITVVALICKLIFGKKSKAEEAGSTSELTAKEREWLFGKK